jgi:elongation factor G
MKVYSTSNIRNVALVGHGGSGKTSLTSGLLFVSGSVKRLGKVEEGTAITDFDEDEIERKISLQTALAHVEWKNKKLNLIDTPGYAAFLADAKVALAAADAALVLVEAVSGAQVITERTFSYAGDFGLPVFFVVSKLDRENAAYDRALESIQERFGREAVPVQLPIGAEHDFAGVVDLIAGKAFRFATDDTGKMSAEDIPADLADRAAEMRSALVEMVAENDETLMETFFEAGDLNQDQLTEGLRKAVAARKLFPVFCTSGTHLIGLQPLMDAIVDLVPAPGGRGEAVGTLPGEETEVRRSVAPDQPVSAFIFKTIADPFAGKLSIFRVCSGTLTADSNVVNVNRENRAERLGGISVMQGKQTDAVKELQAGDLGVVAKLKETQTSDTLADPAHPILYPPVKFREPAISYAVEPKSKGDEEKISTALSRLMEEDPVLRVRRDPQTGELLVSGTGQVHVEVALSKMKRKFGVDAILHPPRVPYQETIKRKVTGIEGKHKKQSGGRGQFGVCVIDMEPLPRGSGFEFVDKIFGGSIPQNYRPAVEKGIREAAARGWLSGAPVVDFRVTLTDGKYHSVDSSEMAFKIAGSLAFQGAMEAAKPIILEPIMAVEITSPEDCMGDIMGDLSQRRGKPQGMDAQGAYQVIKAQVPMAEMLEYASTLKSLTSDRGSYQMEFTHYEEVPGQQQAKIIAEAQKRKEEKAG